MISINYLVMNKIIACFTFLLLWSGQSFAQQLICTAAQQQNNVSWSIGELITETGTVGNMVITQGFNQQIQDFPSAVSELTVRDFSFYPNPVVDKLMLNFNENNSYSWILTDIVGRTLKSKTSCVDREIDMSEFEAGQYILKVTTDNYRQSVIIIKK